MSSSQLNNIIYSIFILLFLMSCYSKEQSNGKNSIQGVWSYVEDDVLNEVHGMSFFTDKYFAFVVNFKTDSSDSIQNILAYSGSYALRDSIVTATISHAHNPALIGQNIRWIHVVDGNTSSYKVLDKDGNVVERGKVKRLE